MASHNPQPTLADYVAIAVCPALIISMVVSLVFFLIEILYAGQYAGRLQWIFFFFVFAAVLIARMSMGDVADRAGLYGGVLAIVVAIALYVLVDYPEDSPLYSVRWLVNLGLMAIIWWSAHRLTWDCTFIDEKVDASGAGLLEAAGFEAPSERGADEEKEIAVVDDRRERRKKPGLSAWWQRYSHYREAQRAKPHSPGVWIIYFSLAALPLFGLGQSVIPPEQLARRQYAFWLMAIYLGSGLGLLLTTSFLGLRRYLRQRKLDMPVTMTGVWLTTGVVLILALLTFGAFLPRPNAEYALVQFSPLARSPEREASRHSVTGGNAGKGQGRAPSNEPNKDKAESSGSGDQSDKEAGGQNSRQSRQGSPQGSSKSGQPQSGSGQKNDQSDQQPEKSEKSEQDQEKTGDQKPDQTEQDKSKDESKEKGSGSRRPPSAGKGESKQSGGRGSPSSKSFTPPSLPSFLGALGPILKWIVFGIVALVVGFVVLRAILKFLANFTNWAKSLLAALQGLWEALFGWWLPTAKAPKTAPEPEEPVVLRPFSSYRNPFWDGPGGHGSPEEVVRYSFEALQAWAFERGFARDSGETPLEFSARLGQEVPNLDLDARRLSALYARAAYAKGRLPSSCLDSVRQFWQRLEQVDQAPLSA